MNVNPQRPAQAFSIPREPVAPGEDPAELALGLWPRLEKSLVEKGMLDGIDQALIRNLARRVPDAEDVALRVVMACLLAAVHAGGLRIPLEPQQLALRLEELLANLELENPAGQNHTQLALRLAETFTRNRMAGEYAAILGTAPDFLPLLVSGSGLYFQKHQHAEASLVARLFVLLQAPDASESRDQIRNFLDTVLERFPLRKTPAGTSHAMVFDSRQKEALDLAMRKSFVIISGGPGTGKTSLATNLLRAWTLAWQARVHNGNSNDEFNRGANSGSNRQFLRPRIRLAAPTGRAAQRLAESLQQNLKTVHYPFGEPSDLATEASEQKSVDDFVSQLPCETLHSLLRYNPGTGEYFHQMDRPLPADLVILDEVSMVDVFALSRLLNALEDKACLVLLGDMDQLPSVDSGSVLADLVPASDAMAHPLQNHIVILDRSHRSEAGILDVARSINSQDGAGALALMETAAEGDTGCHLLGSGGNPSKPIEYRIGWNSHLQSWIDRHYFQPSRNQRASYAELVQEIGALRTPTDPGFQPALESLFAYLDQARILTFTRKGWHGCATVNRRIRERLLPLWDAKAPLIATGGFHGSPILILENDYSKGLFNGDVGVFLRIQGRAMGYFRRGDTFPAFPAAFLPRHETAFAMTVHKSQGSEYDQVLLALPETGNRLLLKETLYTAITRARSWAGVYGPPEVFLEAVSRKITRESGLPEYLQSSIQK